MDPVDFSPNQVIKSILIPYRKPTLEELLSERLYRFYGHVHLFKNNERLGYRLSLGIVGLNTLLYQSKNFYTSIYDTDLEIDFNEDNILMHGNSLYYLFDLPVFDTYSRVEVWIDEDIVITDPLVIIM